MGRAAAGLATTTIAARRLQKAAKADREDTARMWTDELENILLSNNPCVRAMWKCLSEENASKLQTAMSRAISDTRTRGAAEGAGSASDLADYPADLEKKIGGKAGQGWLEAWKERMQEALSTAKTGPAHQWCRGAAAQNTNAAGEDPPQKIAEAAAADRYKRWKVSSVEAREAAAQAVRSWRALALQTGEEDAQADKTKWEEVMAPDSLRRFFNSYKKGTVVGADNATF